MSTDVEGGESPTRAGAGRATKYTPFVSARVTVHLQKELLSSFVPSMVPSGSIWR